MVLPRLVRDSAIYGGADIISKLVGFLTFPMVAAVLSPLAFGALELMLTGTMLLGLVANFGINNALQRFYWDAQTEPAQRPVFVSSGLVALAVLLFAAVVMGFAAVMMYIRYVDEIRVPLSWIGLLAGLVLMAAGQIVQYLLDVTRLHQSPWRFAGIALVSRVMTATAGVTTVLWLGWGLDGLVVAQAIFMVAAVPLAMYSVRKDLAVRVERSAARKLMQFGHPFIYAGLAFWLLGSMDRWLLASFCSVEEVGVFSVAHRFASVILFMSMAFGQAWSPLAIKMKTDNPQSYRSLYADVLISLLCVMSLIGGGIALFASEIMAWVMPIEYHKAGVVLSALALGLVLQTSMQVTAIGISIENKTHLFGSLSWSAAALNLILNLAMIPAFGALGAAAATSLSYVFLASAYLYNTQRLHPLPVPWRKILVLACLWLVLTANLISQQVGLPAASSVVCRIILLLVCLLVCFFLIPWSKTLHLDC